MYHVSFSDPVEKLSVAILIKQTSLNKAEIDRYYANPLVSGGVPKSEIIGFSLKYNEAGKATATIQKEYLTKSLLPALDSLGIKTLYVCDAAYFKTLTKERKAEPHYGYVLPCKMEGYEHMNVVLGTNYGQLFYNPALEEKLDLSLETLISHIKGDYKAIGSDVIKFEEYPDNLGSIGAWLKKLHDYPMLACDTETFSLKFWEAGLGTISFAWNQHEGIAFKVWNNPSIKKELRKFFETYQGKIIWHNGAYDCKVLVYELFMAHLGDTRNMRDGIRTFMRTFEDSSLVTYLATNSCAGNKLGLKDQAQEFLGNWAEDVTDINQVPLKDLLRYNLADTCGTWYVWNKHYDTMVADNQLDLYNGLIKDSICYLMECELTGMPIDLDRVSEVKQELRKIVQRNLDVLERSGSIKALLVRLTDAAYEKDYQNRCEAKEERAKEAIAAGRTPSDRPVQVKDRATFPSVEFNPNSVQQVAALLHEYWDFPVIEKTANKAPACGNKVLKKHLKNIHITQEQTEVIEALIAYGDATKILGTFIKAFEENSPKHHDGHHYLHGNFRVGGTVSGRLSSNSPNLQNLPSGSTFGKLIKSCFKAKHGWIWTGADSASLEDRISALTTKDPNKLKVYTDGYDGHALRAYSYWPDQFPDIDPKSPESVLRIKTHKPYSKWRDKSKTPTFLLTYGGTYHGLKGAGFTEAEAKQIESNYHDLYKVSDDWVAEKIRGASRVGYVTVAFGLRVRTPLLSQTLLGHKNTPREAQAEARTAGNALGQSYCMLTVRAGAELQKRVWASEFADDINLCCTIHDALYQQCADRMEVVHWLNTQIGECMNWQGLPEIQHPEIDLPAELDLFYPSWADEITLPEAASQRVIWQKVQEALAEAA